MEHLFLSSGVPIDAMGHGFHQKCLKMLFYNPIRHRGSIRSWGGTWSMYLNWIILVSIIIHQSQLFAFKVVSKWRNIKKYHAPLQFKPWAADTLWSDGESGFPPYAALILVYFTMSYKQLPKLPGNLDSIEDCYSSEIILFWAKILSERERERER